MGNLADLRLRPAYRKGRNDIAAEFYLPCMSRAVLYQRAVGYFNSTIYIVAWSSLRDFVSRGGKMQIVCSPAMAPGDICAIDEGYRARQEEEIALRLRDEVTMMLEHPDLGKPTRVLAALVAMEVIDLKVAFAWNQNDPARRRLFHDKVGVFSDDLGDAVVFKGSMNETWAGLACDGNLESIDVFVTWGDERERERVRDEREYFESLWKNEFPTVSVRNFPDIAREELVKAADVANWSRMVEEMWSEASRAVVDRTPARKPWPHQSQALEEWTKRGRRGILEHATGSGKTLTALLAIEESLKRGETALVLVPSQLLLSQWDEDISRTLGAIEKVVCGAGHDAWSEPGLLSAWTRKSDKRRLVLATMQTAATDDFLTRVRQGEHLFLVADEVHRMGSPQHRKIMLLETGPRLGLSATPRRAGDPEGTRAIFEYFGGVVPPPFTLKDAIKAGLLSRYMYYVHKVSLSVGEQQEWDRLTKMIHQLYARAKTSGTVEMQPDDRIKHLQIQRARIVKTAEGKASLALQVIRDFYKRGQQWILYCDTQVQMNQVLSILRANGYDAMEYHSEMTGDRKETLGYFAANGGILVSIRCLDEGIDIPSVGHALILASSKNRREFIQRRGRVLRKAEGKAMAFVHDAIVVPDHLSADQPGTSIVEGELARAIQFGLDAENPSSISDLKLIALDFGLDFESLVEEGFEDDDGNE